MRLPDCYLLMAGLAIITSDSCKALGQAASTVAGQALPRISVEHPTGVPLTNHMSTVDFGKALPGTSVERALTIRNIGGVALTDLSIHIEGTHPHDFSATVVPTDPNSPPTGAVNFTVTLAPTAPGERKAVLQVFSNDPDNSPFEVGLSGSSLTPLEIANPVQIAAKNFSVNGRQANGLSAENSVTTPTTPGSGAASSGEAQDSSRRRSGRATLAAPIQSVIELIGLTLQPAYLLTDTTVNAGGKRWRIGDTGAFSLGNFSIFNETDNVPGLSISPNGAISASGNFSVDFGNGITGIPLSSHLSLYGTNGANVTSLMVSYGSNNGPSHYYYNIGGTRTAPSGTLGNAGIFSLVGRGHDGAGFTGSKTAFYSAADGNWNTTNTGTYFAFVGTPNGSTNSAEWARFAKGSLIVGAPALLGAERLRIAGGAGPGTPNATDVLMGAGKIKSGSDIESRGNIFAQGKITATGSLVAIGGIQSSVPSTLGAITSTGSLTNDYLAKINNTNSAGKGLRLQAGANANNALAVLNAAGTTETFSVKGDGTTTIGADPGGSELLRIGGAARANGLVSAGANPRLELAGASRNWSLQSMDADGRFRLFDNTSAMERLTIDSSGILGLGVSPILGNGILQLPPPADRPSGISWGGSLFMYPGSGSALNIDTSPAPGYGFQFGMAGSSNVRLTLRSPSNVENFIDFYTGNGATAQTFSRIAGSSGGISLRTSPDGVNYQTALLSDRYGNTILGNDPGGSEMFRVGGRSRFSGVVTLAPEAGDATLYLNSGGAQAQVAQTPSNDFVVGTQTAHGLSLRTQGAQALYLTPNQTAQFYGDVQLLPGKSLVVGSDPGSSDLLRVGGPITANGKITATQGFRLSAGSVTWDQTMDALGRLRYQSTGGAIFSIQDDGKVGIGIHSPTAALTIAQVGSANTSGIRFLNGQVIWNQYSDTNGRMRIESANGAQMVIQDDGKVGIGTATPSNTLTVNGTISAKEIRVTSNGADYVFEDGYHLMALEEVAEFVARKKHLPGIAPAAEMQREGLPVSDLVTKQLAKIEELTLYSIDLKRQNEALRKELASTQAQQIDILQRLSALEKR